MKIIVVKADSGRAEIKEMEKLLYINRGLEELRNGKQGRGNDCRKE